MFLQGYPIRVLVCFLKLLYLDLHLNSLLSYYMFKQLLLSFFSFTLFASFTGIPVVLHYCQMSMSNPVQKCEMCQNDEDDDELSPCCAAELDEITPVKITADKSCCSEKILAAPLTTESEQQRTQTIANQQSLICSAVLSIPCNIKIQTDFSIYNYTGKSPPGFHPSLSILYSSLLI